MGRDIHIWIVKGGQRLSSDLFDGRNSEWFDDMAGKGCSFEYEHLPVEYGVCPEADDEFKSFENEFGYFDFRYIKVEDFKDWFNKYKPYLKAGYVSEYDKWRMEKKNYIPYDLLIYPEDDRNIFIEYEDEYDCSKYIYDYLIDKNIDNDAWITYCFDW